MVKPFRALRDKMSPAAQARAAAKADQMAAEIEEIEIRLTRRGLLVARVLRWLPGRLGDWWLRLALAWPRRWWP